MTSSLVEINCRHDTVNNFLGPLLQALSIDSCSCPIQFYCYLWQNTSKLLLYKLYCKMILKSFDFQCDFDFQITTSKMILILILNHLYLSDLILILNHLYLSDLILILNHLYLSDLILILKSSTYDDFAHLCVYIMLQKMKSLCFMTEQGNNTFLAAN